MYKLQIEVETYDRRLVEGLQGKGREPITAIDGVELASPVYPVVRRADIPTYWVDAAIVLTPIIAGYQAEIKAVIVNLLSAWLEKHLFRSPRETHVRINKETIYRYDEEGRIREIIIREMSRQDAKSDSASD